MLRLGLIDSIMRNLFGASFTLLLTLILFMNYHIKSCSFASDRTHHLEMLFLLSIPPILLLKQCHLPAIWIIIQLTQVYLLNQLPRRGLILQLAQFQYRAGVASVVWLLSVYVSCSSHYHWTHNASNHSVKPSHLTVSLRTLTNLGACLTCLCSSFFSNHCSNFISTFNTTK